MSEPSKPQPAREAPLLRDFTATLTRDEFRVLEDLACLVKTSKQNVGQRMRDVADSAARILKSKKP